MAHVKAGGTAKNLKDSQSQRLGVKIFGGQKISSGQIILRQRGQKYHPGQNVRLGVDHTIYAIKDGTVKFQKKKILRFTGALHQKTIVHVI
ncbi:MAG TPA: 50S ribosomal protein L27 [bacterium]|nr:50S ribosomal protein L27 [bacterium]HPN67154.1 50S ribosomal protein L27 [bacterium]